MNILNWNLISHPVNWVTIFLMVFIGVMVVNLILHPYHANAGQSTQPLS